MSQETIANRADYMQCLVFNKPFGVDTINQWTFIDKKGRYSFSRCLYQENVTLTYNKCFDFNLEPSRRAESLGKSRSRTRLFSSS